MSMLPFQKAPCREDLFLAQTLNPRKVPEGREGDSKVAGYSEEGGVAGNSLVHQGIGSCDLLTGSSHRTWCDSICWKMPFPGRFVEKLPMSQGRFAGTGGFAGL